MAEELNRRCPVCGCLPRETVHAGPPVVVYCCMCGMVFNDVLTDVDYSQSKYAAGFEEWNQTRYKEAAKRILSLPNSDPDWLILDVGCTTGGLMRQLNWSGFNSVYGIDPDAECCKKATELTNGLVAKQSTLNGVEGHYDCVILSHVLEHIRDTTAAMQKLTEIAGSVYVEVPDAMRYADNETSPLQQFNQEHVNHFSLEHLNNLFVRHGFVLRCCGEYECEPNRFPAIWAWFTKAMGLKSAVVRYVKKSDAIMSKIKEQVAKIEGPVIAWGIGALARRLEPLLRGKVGNVADSYTTGVYTHHKILKPELVIWASWPILVTTILHKDSVLKQIKELGLKNKVITLGE